MKTVQLSHIVERNNLDILSDFPQYKLQPSEARMQRNISNCFSNTYMNLARGLTFREGLYSGINYFFSYWLGEKDAFLPRLLPSVVRIKKMRADVYLCADFCTP
jgi:hypothetical protein